MIHGTFQQQLQFQCTNVSCNGFSVEWLDATPHGGGGGGLQFVGVGYFCFVFVFVFLWRIQIQTAKCDMRCIDVVSE
jgi:hypothetical protein